MVQIIMYSDLESDYINPIDLCTKLNQVRDKGQTDALLTGTVHRPRDGDACCPHVPVSRQLPVGCAAG